MQILGDTGGPVFGPGGYPWGGRRMAGMGGMAVGFSVEGLPLAAPASASRSLMFFAAAPAPARFAAPFE